MAEDLTVVNSQPKLTVEEVRQYLCPQASEKELYNFVQLCCAQNLNPWIREAYLIKYGTAPATIVVGKDVFTKRAQANKKFRGFSAGIILERADSVIKSDGAFKLPTDKLVGGWAKVFVEGYQVPIEAHVSIEEYAKQQSSWKTMPATMIRKVALVQALREAFPEELGGLYDAAEMGTELTVVEPKPAIKRPQSKSEAVQVEKTDELPTCDEPCENWPDEVVAIKKLDPIEFCTSGKNIGKKWVELTREQLIWYRDYYSEQIRNKEKIASKADNEIKLNGIVAALEQEAQ